MARIRTVKPSFFRSRSVKALHGSDPKLVWIGLWLLADDEGRLLDEPEIMAGDLWALSLTVPKIDRILTELHDKKRLIRYEVSGEKYIQITGWEHQKISHPTPSEIPPAPESFRNPPESFRGEGRGREGKGGEEPNRKCDKHQGVANPPNCIACKEQRIAWEAWKEAQKPKAVTSTPVLRKPEDGHRHKKHPAEGYCILCEKEMT